MRLPRVTSAHGALASIELLAVPVAVLATFLLLYLGAGLAVATRNLGALLGLGATGIEVVVGLLVVATVLVILSAGALAVIGYRSALERWFAERNQATLVLVPLIGIVVPFAYTVSTTSGVALSWWLFVIVAISAYALAFRVLAAHSLRFGLRRYDVLVAILTGIPAVAALTVFVTETLLVGPGDEIARLLVTAITGTWIPPERSILVAAPLLTTLLYAIHWIATDGGGWTDRIRPPRWANVDRITSVWSPIKRIADGWPQHRWLARDWTRPGWLAPSWSKPGLIDRLPGRTTGASSDAGATRQRTSSATGWRGPPPVSSSSVKRSRRADRSASGSSGEAAASNDETSSPRAGADSASTARRGREPSSRSAGGRDDGEDESSATNREVLTERRLESSADALPSPRRSSSDAPSSSARRSANGASRERTGSDTRIFVDDFVRYASDDSPVETCPACDGLIPSDSDYLYCPSCGHEL